MTAQGPTEGAVGNPGGPLASVRVLELSIFYAAGQLATYLADLGADVVKVEPPTGDPQRVVGAIRNGGSVAWALVGRGKRSVPLDLTGTEGQAVLGRLLEATDVVIVNQPPAVLERWGCTYEQMAARNPRAIVIAVSAYGGTGPLAGRSGNGTMAEAFGGLTHMIGETDGPPVLPSAPVGDCLAAIWGAFAVTSALYWRDAGGGRGQFIDLSMYEPVLAVLGTVMAEWQPGSPAPIRTGSRYPGGAPRNIYRTADQEWVVLSAPTDNQARRVLEVIGRTGEDDLARFGQSEERLAHAEELDQLVADWIVQQPLSRVVAAFEAANVPVVRVNDLAAVAAHPQVQARGSLSSVADPSVGSVVLPSPGPRFSESPAPRLRPAPLLGEHGDDALADWLGRSTHPA